MKKIAASLMLLGALFAPNLAQASGCPCGPDCPCGGCPCGQAR